MMIFWQFHYCWLLQSVLECVALSLPSLLRSNQSWIALIAPYCMKFLLYSIYLLFVSVCGVVPLGGSIPSKDSLWPSALFSNSLCMFELLCCAWWCCSEAEARNQGLKDYQGLKNARYWWLRIALVTKGPEELFLTRSFGVYILFIPVRDRETLSVHVYWVDTSFPCQEHSFSDKTQKQTMLNDVGCDITWGMDLRIYNEFTMFYPCSRNLSCWKHLET